MRIKELIKYEEKSKIKAGDAVPNGKYPLFTSSEAEDKRYNQYTCDAEGIIMGTGGNATLHYYNGKFAVSTDCLVLKPNHNIKCKYLFYFFKANMNILQAGFKGAGLKHTNKNYIGNIELNRLPDIKQQLKIICKLDKISSIITKHKQIINLLDMLIKSQFVEMFGDVFFNKKNYPVKPLSELSELITKGSSPSWQGFSYTNDKSQTLFVTSENVREDYLDLTNAKYIEDKFNEKQKRSMILNGDILINIVGASIGRAAIFNLDCKANMNQASALVRLKKGTINKKYLSYYLNTDKAKIMYDSVKSDTGRANLSLEDIGNLSIIVPPIEEQNKFESYVRECDKLKFIAQKSLNKSQMLFNSLMQEYFT